jgi:hypothetical protein
MADIVILPEQTIGGFSELSPGIMALNVPIAIPVVVGETYRVTWGADEFVCKAMDVNGQTGFGNLAVAGLGADTQEPFLVAFSTNSTTILTNDTEITTVNVAIYQVVEADKEYLIWGSTLKAIGNAIREKTGKTDAISPNDMPGEIRGITGGGGGSGGSSDDVRYVTFMSYDGTVEYGKIPVAVGYDCPNPKFDTPKRESTAQYKYTFAGWSTVANGGVDENALKAVTEDRIVYANFIATVIYYTISYYDGDTLLKTEQLPYGATPSYSPKKSGSTFTGWLPEVATVTEDASYYAQWVEQITFANGSWEQISNISESGMASETFAVGDTKEITWGGKSYKLVVLGFDHDDLADGSGKAGMTIGCMTAYPTKQSAYASYKAHSLMDYSDSNIRSTISGFSSSPDLSDIVAVAKPVTKYSYRNGDATNILTTDTFFAFSMTEVGTGDKTTGTKYPYFTDNNSRKVVSAGTETNVGYWLRDAYYINGNKYWYHVQPGGTGSMVTDSGTPNYYPVFGFCI